VVGQAARRYLALAALLEAMTTAASVQRNAVEMEHGRRRVAGNW
jgi:hypothetical protein